ncbi:MAG TPA: pyridoxal-phosphate dependent enzyme, partial [Terriglobales bacterium]|nr:pyridoxal-phosphate dependent enzyme [Terriglobales bacterium]
QLNNTDTIAGYASLGEEIWKQAEGKVDAFVQSIGTGASLRGIATVLRRYNPKIKIIAVEPGESSVLSGGPSGAHDIEGIGIGYTPPLWDASLVDEVLSVKTEDAKDMARQLSRKDAIFAGTSSGGNVHAAIRVAKKLGPSSRVVTLMIDSGLKYVSTDLYRQR